MNDSAGNIFSAAGNIWEQDYDMLRDELSANAMFDAFDMFENSLSNDDDDGDV